MPTPEQIQQSSLFINELYQELELELLSNIGRLLRTNQTVTEDNVLQWQITKLQQLGRLNQEQIRTVARFADQTPEKVQEWIQEVGMMAVNEIETGIATALPNANVPSVSESNAIINVLLLFERQAQDTMNLVNTTMLNGSRQAYIDIVTRTTAEVLTGLSTHDQALRKTAREWAEKGMPALVDRAGKRWSTEAYINMVTRTVSAQVTAKAQEARMDDYDIDLVEISSHAGSRPAHIDFQGKIYSRSGRARTFPSLSSTSYGRIDGIVTGINCTHVMYPYVQGKSIKRSEDYNKRESIKKYEESQKQRYLEREIRKAKRELKMMEDLNDPEAIQESKRKVRQKQANLRAFIDDTGRTRRRNREQIQ